VPGSGICPSVHAAEVRFAFAGAGQGLARSSTAGCQARRENALYCNHQEFTMMTTTIERLRAILIKDYKFAPDVLVPAALLEELGIDSLGTAELLFNIEDEFGVILPPDPVQMSTLGDVVGFIDGLIAQQGAAEVQSQPTPEFPQPTA
jgi:acyl carrier protein